MSTYTDGDIVRTVSKERRPTGGQSIPAFDHYMAPGVAKTFVKELYRVLRIRHPECGADQLKKSGWSNEAVKLHLKGYLKKHRLILDNVEYIHELLLNEYAGDVGWAEVKRIIAMAIEATEDATHQAMEAVIHNLNSMHCLPYYQKLWVLDTFTGEFQAMQIGDLTASFENDRFKVVSLNTKTGKAELKFVTAAKNMGNNRKLYKVTNNQGATVTTTDNHRIMTLNGLSIEADYPSSISNTISPRGIKLPAVNNDICLDGYGTIRKDSPYLERHIAVTEDFARFMGYYMADGSMLKNTGTMCLTTCGKVPFTELQELVHCAFGKGFKEHLTYFEHSINGTTEKDYRIGIGMRLSRMVEDKFGRIGKEKKIPTEIMFAPDNIKEAFLQGYFRCDGSATKKYGEAATVNKELQAQIVFMLYSLKVSSHLSTRSCTNGFDSTKDRLNMHFITFLNEDAARVGIKENDTAFSIPKYDLTMVPRKYTKDIQRSSKNVRYTELEDMIRMSDAKDIEHLENIFINKVESVEALEDSEVDVFDISVEDNENFMTQDGIYVHNSRAGAQVPFSSLNFGTDISPEGRMVIKYILMTTEEGLGNGETPIFPKQHWGAKE